MILFTCDAENPGDRWGFDGDWLFGGVDTISADGPTLLNYMDNNPEYIALKAYNTTHKIYNL